MKKDAITRRQWCKLGAATLTSLSAPGLFVLSTPASAQAYPNRPIKMISPWTPGGGTDLVGRNLATAMSQILGQSIIYENKPGGGTVIGSDYVAKAAPDGYTLLLTTSAHSINSSLIKNLPYNTEKSFADVALICKGPNILVTRPDSPYKTVKDIIAAAKANPGKLTYGSSGNGSAVHLTAELFKLMAKVDITHVPYKGAGPAVNAALTGEVQFSSVAAPAASQFIKTGKLVGLAVTSAKRLPSLPEIPTVAESGFPGFEDYTWVGVFVPKATNEAIVEKMNADIQKILDDPSFKERLANIGFDAGGGSVLQFNQYLKKESLKWSKVVNEIGIPKQ